MPIGDICVVTGATGCAGPELVRQLIAAGYRVRILARHPPLANLLPECAELHIADINDQAILKKAFAGSRYVFHLAAKLHIARSRPGSEQEYNRVNLDGTRNVLEVCRESGVQRLIYFSTINVYGTHPAFCASVGAQRNEVVDEDAVPNPCGIYAETKRRAEEIVLEGSTDRAGRSWATVLRLAAIYGQHMKGNYVRLLHSLSRRRFLPVGDGTNRRTVVHEEDAARAAHLAAEHPAAGGRIYNVSDGQIHTVGEILSAISQALGQQPPRLFISARVAQMAARIVDAMLKPVGSLNLELAVEKLTEDMPVRAERVQQELGFRPNIELQQGWSRTVEEWKRGVMSGSPPSEQAFKRTFRYPA
jgi:nucleoside-diphosphate-sugar epimerase